MQTGLPSGDLSSVVPADCYQNSAPLITAIRRDQMPEDIRSAFLPRDTIVFCKRHHCISSFGRMKSKSHSLVNPKCLWCRADNVCAGLILLFLTALIWLGAGCTQTEETSACYFLGYSLSGLSVMAWFPAIVIIYKHCRADGYSSVSIRCSQGVKFHCVRFLASQILSSSSLFLLQQPMLNLRSFYRYYNFFTHARADELPDEEIDNCVRQLVFEDSLRLATLIGDDSHALLGLEPCQDTFMGLRWGVSWPNVLYQSFRDWKRWRLATFVCERIHVRGSGLLQQGGMDGHDLLTCVGGRGGHKWFLVDPELFIPKFPSNPRKA